MSEENKVPITVMIAARNEAVNIVPAVESVLQAEKIYVLDSQSTDETVARAEAAGAEVVQFKYDGGWPKKRNWGLENLEIVGDWVLFLDADERVPPELMAEISRAIQDEGCNGYYLKWKFMFLGKWMKHSWSHGWMLRLVRKGKGAYEDLGMRGQGGWDTEVHENIVAEGRMGRLETPLLHETNQDLSFWIRKQNEFSDWNAARRRDQLKEPVPPLSYAFSGDAVKRRKWLKAVFIRLPMKPCLMFCYLYFIKCGFLDGRAGYLFCRLRAIHEFNILAKMYEMKQNGSSS